jgi:hypothetical protein
MALVINMLQSQLFMIMYSVTSVIKGIVEIILLIHYCEMGNYNMGFRTSITGPSK